MIQKKVCMVGAFAVGKTSLVQQFVHSKFSARYLSTVGVKIDRKEMEVDGTPLNLVLWDLAGQDHYQGVQVSYLKGAAAVIYVLDGTRRETLTALDGLVALVEGAVGAVPSVIAVNKADLTDDWQFTSADLEKLAKGGRFVQETSAKSGAGVTDLFTWIGRALLKA